MNKGGSNARVVRNDQRYVIDREFNDKPLFDEECSQTESSLLVLDKENLPPCQISIQKKKENQFSQVARDMKHRKQVLQKGGPPIRPPSLPAVDPPKLSQRSRVAARERHRRRTRISVESRDATDIPKNTKQEAFPGNIGSAVQCRSDTLTCHANNDLSGAVSSVIDSLLPSTKPAATKHREGRYVGYAKSLIDKSFSEDKSFLIFDADTVEWEEALLSKDQGYKSVLFVDDYDEPAFHTMLDRLRFNKSCEKVEIYRSWEGVSGRTRSTQELRWIFEALRALPKLDMLYLWNFEGGDLVDIFVLLYCHPTLNSFRIHLVDGFFNRETLRALSTALTLREVVLDVSISFPIGELFQSKSLQAIRIASDDLVFQREHVLELSSALTFNSSVTWLELQPKIGAENFQIIAHALAMNQSLKTLRVSVVGEGEQAELATTELANLFVSNSTLKELSNLTYNSFKVSAGHKVRVLEALYENHTIENFVFFEEDFVSSWRKEFTLVRNIFEGDGSDMPEDWTLPCDSRFVEQASSHSNRVQSDLRVLYEQILPKTSVADFTKNVTSDLTKMMEKAIGKVY